MKYIAEVDGLKLQVEILDEHHVCFGNEILEVDLAAISGQPFYSLIVNGESFEGYVYLNEDCWQVLLLGRSYSISIEDERENRLRTSNAGNVSPSREFALKAPMPGLAVAVPVSEGQRVEKGEILAPFAGTAARLRVKAGESVQQKQTLLTVLPSGEEI
jgi:acetyl/propionyl-CoA carboxylase alpha subunit